MRRQTLHDDYRSIFNFLWGIHKNCKNSYVMGSRLWPSIKHQRSFSEVHSKKTRSAYISAWIYSISRIRELYMQGLSPFQICTPLRVDGSPISWHQVHYRWSLIQKQDYLRNEDPFISCKAYVESCSNLNLIFGSSIPKAVAFVTDIGEHAVREHECAEYFFESTYKTNSSLFELFTVITKVFEAGWPLLLLFFEGNRPEIQGSNTRQHILKNFLDSLRDSLPQSRPKFFSPTKILASSRQYSKAIALDL